MTVPPHVLDIEHWRPRRLGDICGNYDFKEYVEDLIWMVRKRGHTGGFNLLYTGDTPMSIPIVRLDSSPPSNPTSFKRA